MARKEQLACLYFVETLKTKIPATPPALCGPTRVPPAAGSAAPEPAKLPLVQSPVALKAEPLKQNCGLVQCSDF